MTSKSQRRRVSATVLASLPLLFLGCSGADNPKIVEAPAPNIEPSKEPPKVPGRKDTYGANPKYQKAMERLGKGGG